MTLTQNPDVPKQALSAKVKDLPLAVKIMSGSVLLALLGGGITVIALSGGTSDHVASVVASETPTPTIVPTVKDIASAKPTSTTKVTKTAKAADSPSSKVPAGAQVQQENPIVQAQPAPAQESEYVIGGNNEATTENGGAQAAAPAPKPAPAPAPVPKPAPSPAPAPEPVPPAPLQPPGRTEGINQSLASINTHRIANGLPAFRTDTDGCRAAASATGTALDSYQHQNIVLSGYDAATFVKGVEWDTLTVWSC